LKNNKYVTKEYKLYLDIFFQKNNNKIVLAQKWLKKNSHKQIEQEVTINQQFFE
jgi:hypothetical protein